MVMKAFGKSAVRLFGKHIVRLITIIAIVTVSIGVTSGIGEVEGRIKRASDGYYLQQNVHDLHIKSNRGAFSDAELGTIYGKFGESNVSTGTSYEIETDDGIIRMYFADVSAWTVNKTELISGRFPQTHDEILAERATENFKSYDAGDVLAVSGKTYTVCGTVLNPLYINKVEERSMQFDGKNVDYVLYALPSAYMPVSDVYITLNSRTLFDSFGKSYKREVQNAKNEIISELGAECATVLTLYENAGLYSLVSYAEKVGLIGIIFVVFFLLVTMLVVYSNMSRLFDEERGQIACLKTLGYSNCAITSRYSLFVFLGTVAGGLIALPIGLAVTYIVYKAFNIQYAMPPFPGIGSLGYYFVTFSIITVSMLLLTFFTGLKTVRNKPVTLLGHKAPKAGKKVILEHIGFIWNRLSFKYKSTLRNVLLFKSRFFMTVISIIGSTVLVLAGFGLMDCSVKLPSSNSIFAIAAVLIIFSAMLCALVIYNLTNINVSERNREIATLMVLGYRDKEITGYIFREIYIMSILGAVIGVPCGLGFMQFVFGLIDFGSVGDINWWTWIVAPAVTVFFAFLSTLMLRNKILKTDMNASLKTLE